LRADEQSHGRRSEGAIFNVLDDDAWLLLHEVRLRGLLDTDDDHARALVEVGFVAQAARGLRPTPAGREAHATWARLEPGSDDEMTMQRAYERFLSLNRELIRVCNDWQVRAGGVPNDHRDARYDWSVIDRVHALDEKAAPIAKRAARVHPRFETYRPRLRAALARVDDGEHDWLTSPRCDSYHTVWMQWHEDLLLALGIDRASEPEQA
jgi:hypothetical protein